MAKGKAAPARAPAWMVTFADLMSLLVCFFVLIISFSVQDEQKLQVVAGSVRDAFGVSRDWQARALVEIEGRPEARNIELPPHRNIVVFMPKPDRPPPEDAENETERDSDPVPVESQSDPAKESDALLSSAADFLEVNDYAGDSLHAQIGDPGAVGGPDGQGAGDLAANWRDQFRVKQTEAAEERFVETVEDRVEALARERPELAKLAENVKVERSEEGVRIQLIADLNLPMFPLGSDEFGLEVKPLLREVAALVKSAGSKIIITGHTDARPYRGREGYDNWNLSSDRAHATRRALVDAGVNPAQIVGVLGKGDSDHAVPGNPNDPRNRRIGILLLRDS